LIAAVLEFGAQRAGGRDQLPDIDAPPLAL
jgi:hypothetical protein